MANDVSDAKLHTLPENLCDISEVEICYKGVHEIYTVDEHGAAIEVKETWLNESYPAYFYCTGCGEDWDIHETDRDEVWEKVKAHCA